MGYITRHLLTSDEQVMFEVHLSWWHLLPKVIPLYAILLIGGIIALLGDVIVLTDEQSIILTIGIVIGMGLITGIATLIHTSKEYVVTSTRVITKEGIIANSIYEIAKGNIESINIDQGISGRIFNYGTLELNGTGNEDRRIVNIANPVEFKKAVRHIEHEEENPE